MTPPRVIYGPRQSGRTTKLVALCKTLNETARANTTVIMAKSHNDACRIKRIAEDMDYPGMPFPVTFEELYHMKASQSWYKNVLIDDMDVFVQKLLYDWNLVGYTINSEEFLDKISAERIPEDGE